MCRIENRCVRFFSYFRAFIVFLMLWDHLCKNFHDKLTLLLYLNFGHLHIVSRCIANMCRWAVSFLVCWILALVYKTPLIFHVNHLQLLLFTYPMILDALCLLGQWLYWAFLYCYNFITWVELSVSNLILYNVLVTVIYMNVVVIVSKKTVILLLIWE